jgi:hypothetical protein
MKSGRRRAQTESLVHQVDPSPTEQISLVLPKELLSLADELAKSQPVPTSRAAVLRLAVMRGLPILLKQSSLQRTRSTKG